MRGHSLHLALQALTVCPSVLRAPNFASRLVTDVFVEKMAAAEMALLKNLFFGRWREPSGKLLGGLTTSSAP